MVDLDTVDLDDWDQVCDALIERFRTKESLYYYMRDKLRLHIPSYVRFTLPFMG